MGTAVVMETGIALETEVAIETGVAPTVCIFKHEFFGRAWNVRKRYEFYQCSQVIWLRQLE